MTDKSAANCEHATCAPKIPELSEQAVKETPGALKARGEGAESLGGTNRLENGVA
jgi:hypothetical protein